MQTILCSIVKNNLKTIITVNTAVFYLFIYLIMIVFTARMECFHMISIFKGF